MNIHWTPLLISLSFLVLNLVALTLILAASRPKPAKQKPPAEAPALTPATADGRVLSPLELLGWEFEYARTTASEAMADRHTMINFYLLVFGILISAVMALLTGEAPPPLFLGTLLLWMISLIGWFYFLKIIKLRISWFDSALAMNQIKIFHIQHAQSIEPAELLKAFRWQPQTIPPPGKPWTLFFYSAMLIGFLNSVAYLFGSILLDLSYNGSKVLGEAIKGVAPGDLLILLLFAAGLFAFHAWLYSKFLATPSKE